MLESIERSCYYLIMKSSNTKIQILDTALEIARNIGLESLSIGELAKTVGMSKSGLFAHFKSKETLQVMLLDHAADSFTKQVVMPAITLPRGLERLNALIDNWLNWSFKGQPGSCPLVAAAIEFDDRPGLVKDRVKLHLSQLHNSLERACRIAVEEDHLKKTADTHLMAQEIFSFILAYHLYSKTLNDDLAEKRFYKSISDLVARNKL